MRHPADIARRAVALLLSAFLACASGTVAFHAVAAGPAARKADAPDPADKPDAPDLPEPPEPPEPPTPPDASAMAKGLRVPPGEVHKGDIYRLAPSADIEGTQDGDLALWAPTAQISGVVTGDVAFVGSQINITGEVKRSVRAFAANVVVDGTIDGNLLVVGGSVTLGGKAHVLGNVSSYTGQFTHNGTIDGTLTFAGGTSVLGGKVGGNAELTADAITIEKGAHIDGNLAYSTRTRIDDELKPIVSGTISYDEKPIARKHAEKTEGRSLRPTRFGIGKWLAFFLASYLFGCAFVALFRAHEGTIVDTIRKDPLRTLGIGFVSVLVTIAVALSAILFVTIPFIFFYYLAYLVLWYLARVPVALWTGRAILGRLGRPHGPYAALLVGLVPLHLLFVIPVLGPIVHWVLMPLLGMGAMITTYIAIRQSKRRSAAPTASPAEAAPPQAS